MSLLVLRVRRLRDRARDWPVFWLGAVGVGLALAALASISAGAVPIAWRDLLGALGDRSHPSHPVLWQVRVPRALGGALVGTALAVSGALLQTVVRNPLADPGILGVTAGAGAAGLLAIVFAPEAPLLVPVAAFAGGLGAIAILGVAAWTSARSAGPLRIVLTGVALQAVFFAAVALTTFLFADRAPAFAAFTVGSLNGVGWSDVALVAAPTACGLALAAATLRAQNVLLLDDGSAGGVGLSVRRARFGLASISALLTAGAVSIAGLVGFVGLVVPNAVRLLVGPDHRVLLPIVALGGALLVLLADLGARTATAPLELPVGALLALVGGPYFLFLIWKTLP